MRWIDVMEKDLRNLGVVNWKIKAQERDGWRKSRPRPTNGCANNNNNNNICRHHD
jgi:hypothetical protein